MDTYQYLLGKVSTNNSRVLALQKMYQYLLGKVSTLDDFAIKEIKESINIY